jgi:DNA-binding response OmpR family regulator
MTVKRILIAEDDLFLQQIYQRSLTEAGYEVDLASDGKQALEKLKADHIDLVLIDLKMPVMSGEELILSLKKDPSLSSLPFMVLTNTGEDEITEKCKEWGAKGCFTKSNLSFEEIIERIRSIIGEGNVVVKESKKQLNTTQEKEPSSTRRVLVVEDDPFLLQIYRQNLEERGFSVMPVESGAQALDILERDQHYEVIILDLLMPEMDGFTVLEKLSGLGVSKKIPVIVLTNLSQESDHKKALELGAKDFAIKSELSFDEIVAKVEAALRSSPSA